MVYSHVSAMLPMQLVVIGRIECCLGAPGGAAQLAVTVAAVCLLRFQQNVRNNAGTPTSLTSLVSNDQLLALPESEPETAVQQWLLPAAASRGSAKQHAVFKCAAHLQICIGHTAVQRGQAVLACSCPELSFC